MATTSNNDDMMYIAHGERSLSAAAPLAPMGNIERLLRCFMLPHVPPVESSGGRSVGLFPMSDGVQASQVKYKDPIQYSQSTRTDCDFQCIPSAAFISADTALLFDSFCTCTLSPSVVPMRGAGRVAVSCVTETINFLTDVTKEGRKEVTR